MQFYNAKLYSQHLIRMIEDDQGSDAEYCKLIDIAQAFIEHAVEEELSYRHEPYTDTLADTLEECDDPYELATDDNLELISGVIDEVAKWTQANYYTHNDVEQHLIDTLDDVHGEIVIGSSTFSPGEIMKELEPVTWRCMLSDEISHLMSDGNVVIKGQNDELDVDLTKYDQTEPVRYERIEASDPNRADKLKRQREQFYQDAEQGKQVCLTDIMSNHGM